MVGHLPRRTAVGGAAALPMWPPRRLRPLPRRVVGRKGSHSVQHFPTKASEFLAQRHDESNADRLLLPLHGARGVPFAKAEPRAVRHEASPHRTAVTKRYAQSPERRADEVQSVLRKRSDQDFVAQVFADDATFADDEPADDREKSQVEEKPKRQHQHYQHAGVNRRSIPDHVQEHRSAIAEQGGEPAQPSLARFARDAESDSGH